MLILVVLVDCLFVCLFVYLYIFGVYVLIFVDFNSELTPIRVMAERMEDFDLDLALALSQENQLLEEER